MILFHYFTQLFFLYINKVKITEVTWKFICFSTNTIWQRALNIYTNKKAHKHCVCGLCKIQTIIFLRIWNSWFHWYKYTFCYLCVTYKGIFLKLLATFISITFLSYFYQFIILYFIFLCLKASSPPSKIVRHNIKW